jgi:hypothetical protein
MNALLIYLLLLSLSLSLSVSVPMQRQRGEAVVLPAVLHQAPPAGAALQGARVAHHHHAALGARDGHVHAPVVVQKADPVARGSHAGDDDDVLLPPLEGVDRVHLHLLVPGQLPRQAAPGPVDEAPEQRPLPLVRRDHAHAEPAQRGGQQAEHAQYELRLEAVHLALAVRAVAALARVRDVKELHRLEEDAGVGGRHQRHLLEAARGRGRGRGRGVLPAVCPPAPAPAPAPVGRGVVVLRVQARDGGGRGGGRAAGGHALDALAVEEPPLVEALRGEEADVRVHAVLQLQQHHLHSTAQHSIAYIQSVSQSVSQSVIR